MYLIKVIFHLSNHEQARFFLLNTEFGTPPPPIQPPLNNTYVDMLVEFSSHLYYGISDMFCVEINIKEHLRGYVFVVVDRTKYLHVYMFRVAIDSMPYIHVLFYNIWCIH